MQSNPDEPAEILSDDEDENESRLSCSLRWLISKAYPHGTIPDYLPCEHFFQNEHDERFLSPDIALVVFILKEVLAWQVIRNGAMRIGLTN